MEVKYTLTQALRDVFMAALGIAGGVLTRQFRTLHEKSVENFEFTNKLADELKVTTEELVSSLRDARITKRRLELLIGYQIQTFEYMKRNHLKPLPLPKELESDPDLIKFFSKKKKRV